MNLLLQFNLFLLLLVAVFDPSDQVTHLKVPLFVCLWFIFFFGFFVSTSTSPPLSNSLLAYILVFAVFLPLTSILWYYLRGENIGQYDGFQYLKSFLFLTLAFILVVRKIDAMRPLSIVLSILSVVIITIAVLTYDDPALSQLLGPIGDATGMFMIGDRTYGGLTYTYVYFHSAPLLVLSLAYFSYRSLQSKSLSRFGFGFLLILNFFAMLCSGTRNDIIFGILTPLLVLFWHSGKHRRLALTVLFLGIVVVLGFFSSDIIGAMFDPENESNAIKLAHLKDYSVLFSQTKTLLFGQGLGAYFYSTAFGTATSITELTYLEFIRNFGLFITGIYYALLVYPLTRLRDQTLTSHHYLLLAFISYLFMCASNPLLVSSTGMLALAIVLSAIFPAKAPRLNQETHNILVPQQVA